MKYLLPVLALTCMSSPVLAQDAVNADEFLQDQKVEQTQAPQQVQEEVSEVEAGLAEAKAELEDEATLARKTELAKEMHNIRPTRVQIDAAVDRASMALLPQDRENFVAAMKSMLNYNAIERISIDAMIETFTLKELEAMVEYYSKPEAMSASAKTPLWASKIQPEIVRMIDKAMIKIRTGQ